MMMFVLLPLIIHACMLQLIDLSSTFEATGLQGHSANRATRLQGYNQCTPATS
jgi:hypothetical protein